MTVTSVIQKPKNSGKKTLFHQPLLERLSRTHIAVPISIFLLFSGALLAWSITTTSLTIGMTVTMFVTGLVSFTWVEYQTHRYLFHIPVTSQLRAKWQYLIHGVHHEFPKDKGRLAMPPLVSLTIATILLLLFRLALGDLAFAFLPGFLTGYAGYLLVHYMIHSFQPPANFLKILWVNHSIHHYKNGESVFGVSSPFWDYVYGTMEKNSRSANRLSNHPESQMILKANGEI
jgi:sterol desaturase/sphingolipid hydroxylase (fatty acid hydroxylase superfamily)